MAGWGISLGVLADFLELLQEGTRVVIVIEGGLVAFIDYVHFAKVLLQRQRLDGDDHCWFFGEDMVLVPCSGWNVHRVSRLPFDLVIVDVGISLAAQHDNDGFVVLVSHRVCFRRIDMAVNFDDAVVKAQVLGDQTSLPKAILVFIVKSHF